MPTTEPELRLILDTHVWFWLVTGDRQVRRGALKTLERRGGMGVSAISVWEICMLDQKGRIRLGMDRMEWIRRALLDADVRVVPLSPEIAVESTRLPGRFPGDPADRIIVASARIHGVPVATRDRQVLAYAREGFVKAMEA